MDLLFSAMGSLTSGLITDLQTAIIALLAIGFLIMGIDHLKFVFESAMEKRQTNSSLDRARSYKKMADSMDDQVSKDYLNARYRNEIRKASR